MQTLQEAFEKVIRGSFDTAVQEAVAKLSRSFERATAANNRFSQKIEGWIPMETEQTTNSDWRQIPKRKRRFHLNAENRAATNWAGTSKMLKLLAPCGVKSGARALDIINAKFGL